MPRPKRKSLRFCRDRGGRTRLRKEGSPTEEGGSVRSLDKGFFNSPSSLAFHPHIQTIIKKEPPTLPYLGQSPGRGGSPFFRCYDVAKRPDTAYKRERVLPIVPNPGPRTQTLSKEWYSLPYHEGSNQRATPFSLALLIRLGRGREAPGPEASCFSFYFFCSLVPNAPAAWPLMKWPLNSPTRTGGPADSLTSTVPLLSGVASHEMRHSNYWLPQG